MKHKNKFLAPFLFTLGVVLFFSSPNRTNALAVKGNSTDAWVTDFSAAQALSKENGKPMLLEFTGSDWCPPCMRMNKEVFSQETFLTYAGENLILVKLDFPRRKEQAADLKEQNEALAQQYEVRGFPTVVLVSPGGEVINSDVGFRPGGAEAYVEYIKGVLAAQSL